MPSPRPQTIRIRGARVHNLKNVDVDLPHNAITVITGVSGSGKSSLAFDTLYAESRRRFLENVSHHARHCLDRFERPDVDRIDGLPPAIGVDQRVGSIRPRSTLATTTETYDFLRLLYARAGQAHCPACGRPVSQRSAQSIVDAILSLEQKRKVMILAPLIRGRKGQHRDVFEEITREGFVRARVNGEIVDAADPPELPPGRQHSIEAVVDRIVIKDGIRARLQESVEAALRTGGDACLVTHLADDTWHDALYSARLACPECEVSLPDFEPRSFSFNSPYGACPDCEGLGVSADNSDAETPDDDASQPLTSQICPECQGARLNAAARAVTFAGVALHELTAMTVERADRQLSELASGIDDLELTPQALAAARTTLPEIAGRVGYLNQVGLGYLTLDRRTRSLSGGEFQRARLAGCLGSGLLGVNYILDEPTIGLHSRDTGRLIRILEELRDAGNTVTLVEHDGTVIRAADHVIDVGPGAGMHGGTIVATGTPAEISACPGSPTGRYLTKSTRNREYQEPPRNGLQISIRGANIHNLKQLDVDIPLGALTAVTGVSGSGKSSLILHTLVPAVRAALDERPKDDCIKCGEVSGTEHIDRVILIDSSPLGRNGRSNPATASGAWDEIRKVFAATREARIRGYAPRRFSFNVAEGRCKKCAGQGTQRIEMHFLPDMHVPCEACRGARFNRRTLAVRYRGKNVAQVLEMPIDEAAGFFENFPKLHRTLQTFRDVGLGYLTLGQSALALSGGEAQRIKLAAELCRSPGERTLYVLDEPTTGLHASDIALLVTLLKQIVEKSNTVVVIEHQLDLIAECDWIVDLGPEGGQHGGTITATGTPAQIAASATHTGRALAAEFSFPTPSGRG